MLLLLFVVADESATTFRSYSSYGFPAFRAPRYLDAHLNTEIYGMPEKLPMLTSTDVLNSSSFWKGFLVSILKTSVKKVIATVSHSVFLTSSLWRFNACRWLHLYDFIRLCLAFKIKVTLEYLEGWKLL